MVSGAIREPSEQIRWRVLRFVAWWYVVYGTGTLCIDIVFVGPGPLQLGNVLAILAGVLTLHRKPFAAWMFLAFHVSGLLMQFVFAREDALTGRLIETLSEGLGVVLAAAIFILVQKVFRPIRLQVWSGRDRFTGQAACERDQRGAPRDRVRAP